MVVGEEEARVEDFMAVETVEVESRVDGIKVVEDSLVGAIRIEVALGLIMTKEVEEVVIRTIEVGVIKITEVTKIEVVIKTEEVVIKIEEKEVTMEVGGGVTVEEGEEEIITNSESYL